MSELQHDLHPQRPAPLDPSLPPDANGADAGLPPTPPTMSQDGQPAHTADSSPASDALVKSLVSKHSSLSTPVNARSPPTPDPSPPRTNDSKTVTTPLLERPPMVAYPSSRAESFQTAREDPLSSEPSESRSATPLVDRLSTVNEDRGLGLAFERDDNDVTPTDALQAVYPAEKMDVDDAQATAGAQETDKEPRIMEDIPNREWDTNLMRNVTVRRKRNPRISPRRASEKPQIQDRETADAAPAVAVVETASPCPSPRPCRTSSLRERVVASNSSPVTPSIENFAQSIGWPTEGKATPEEKDRVASDKRNSTSSMGSTVVEAKIIVTPPRRRQTLRHSGKNMAYKRDDGSPTPDRPSRSHSVRNSLQSEDVPLHRLVHKRVSIADRARRTSVDSEAPGSVVGSYIGSYIGSDRYFSTPVSARSMRQRTIDSSAATLRHQESVRNVLQPAADILSRSNTITRNRPHRFDQSPDLRISSAPEAAREAAPSAASRRTPGILSSTPVNQSRPTNVAFRSPIVEQLSPVQSPVQSPVPSLESPRLRKRQQRVAVTHASQPANFNKSLPDLPQENVPPAVVEPPEAEQASTGESYDDKPPPAALMERVRQLVAEREAKDQVQSTPEVKESPSIPVSPPQTKPKTLSPSQNTSSPGSGGSPSSKVQPRERRGSSMSQDRIPWSPATQHSSIEDIYRRSSEWRRPSLDHGRVSFDRSTIRTEEHAMARHLYAQTTPFSQFSDTPIEVSEATAVSIYPHNNHSLLVVQQVPRAISMAPEPHQLEAGVHLSPNDERALQSTPTPPFVDASEGHDMEQVPTNPTVQVEPSTPPMQLLPPQPAAVDSPLKNPRPPPEPPKIMFIPPTPAEELEKQLVPGPPKRSDSHPQRRLSLVQKARRYSDNLLPTLLGRSSSARGRYTNDSQSQRSDGKPKVPSVNDEDGTLHPFWRPRGFWDGFEDSESESDEEALPRGGDTSDIEPEPSSRPKRTTTLSRRLTSGFRGSGGFLIGNSLGVERHGTNKRRHHITLPPNFPRMPRTSSHVSPPKVIIQSPTAPLGPHKSAGITKRGSRSSLSLGGAGPAIYDIPSQRKSWRQGRPIPGLKKYQVQYIGFSGVKDRFRERGQEKRREKIRKSIGMRYYVEPNTPGAGAGEESSTAAAAAAAATGPASSSSAGGAAADVPVGGASSTAQKA